MMTTLPLMELRFDETAYTAQQAGKREQFCPVCGREKLWRRMQIGEMTRWVCLQCECEAMQEQLLKAKMDAEQRKARLEQRFSMAQLGKRFVDADFASWMHSDETENAYSVFKRFADDFCRETERGICVFGRPGNGKSRLAAAAVNEIIRKGYTAVFQEVPDLLTKIKATYGGDGNEADLISTLVQVDLLVLDDAGAEKPSEWVSEKLYQVINGRWKAMKPIIITANVRDMKELKTIYDPRTYSRITDMVLPVKNDGSDMRRINAIQRLRGQC